MTSNDYDCNRCRQPCPAEKVARGLMTPWSTGDPMSFEECREEGFPTCYGNCETCRAYAKIKKDPQTKLIC